MQESSHKSAAAAEINLQESRMPAQGRAGCRLSCLLIAMGYRSLLPGSLHQHCAQRWAQCNVALSPREFEARSAMGCGSHHQSPLQTASAPSPVCSQIYIFCPDFLRASIWAHHPQMDR